MVAAVYPRNARAYTPPAASNKAMIFGLLVYLKGLLPYLKKHA